MVAGPFSGEPIVIETAARLVQADGDQAPAASGAAGRTPFEELNAALAEARAKLDELTSAAEIAAITEDLRTELASAKEENRRLADELAQARSALDAVQAQLDEADAELEQRSEALRQRSAREEALVEAAERAAAQVAYLREQLTAGEDKLATLERERQETQARMTEVKEALSGTLAEAAQLRQQLATTEAALGTAEQERDAARAASEQLRSNNQNLERSLATARAQADRLRAERSDMEERLARLQDAADNAATAARANLLAMEDKIGSLNTALAQVRRQKSPAATTIASPPEGGDGVPDPAQKAESARAPAATLPMPPQATPAAARKQVAARDDRDRVTAEPGGAGSDASTDRGRQSLARATAALPLEERMQVQALLADLKAEPEERGLRLTVPGGMLFETNSDRVQEAAHETLAKVAEVIDIYDGHEVLITGHTDAVGEAGYNEALSERRAALVKAFFVDHFDVDDARLVTRGLGEQRPLASNATQVGRQANRRVEVLILD